VGDQKIYQIFYNASSLSGFLIWLGIAVCHLRFRKAWVAQGRSLDGPEVQIQVLPLRPVARRGFWFLVVLFGANIGVFQAPVFSWFDCHHRLPDDSGFHPLLPGPQSLETRHE